VASPDIKQAIKEKYGQAALRATSGGSACCASAPTASKGCDPITSNLYDLFQSEQLPEAAVLASLGCGNPTALANLNAGEVVLDLGSGGGIDVLLSAKRVGPTGKAYGLDMTDDMLALARENQKKASVQNVEFLKGTIEEIPLPIADPVMLWKDTEGCRWGEGYYILVDDPDLSPIRTYDAIQVWGHFNIASKVAK